ncbi:MAG: tetratricopeptide repeat protein [Bacteroidota bacterium]|jgi:tetratricopeptide (TPR) repeat protein
MKIIYCSLLIVISLPLFAGTKTFVREYTYKAGEADSKITSRSIALDQVKRILLEEIGVYLQSSIETKKEERDTSYKELTTEQVQSITAGITETKIIEERWNGDTYYIKASITVDPDEVNKNIARIGADQTKLKELEDVKRKADDAFAEIERLRKELSVTISEKDKILKQKEYNTASNTLSAADWLQKGYNAHELKEYDNAILYFQKAIELDPKDAEPYAILGAVYNQKGNLVKAIQCCEKAIELNPGFSGAYNNLGLAYKNKGDFDKAIQLFHKAIELNPGESRTFYNLGNTYTKIGNLEKAIQSYEKAIEFNPQYSAAYVNLGISYYSKYKGDLDKAIQLHQKATEANPQDSTAYVNLEISYYSKYKGDLNKAIQLYQKAIEVNPQDYAAYNNLGIAYYSNNNLDDAISSYEKAIEINPLYSNAYVNLGNAYYEKGNLDSAVQFMKRAAKLGDMDAQNWLTQNGYSW